MTTINQLKTFRSKKKWQINLLNKQAKKNRLYLKQTKLSRKKQ